MNRKIEKIEYTIDYKIGVMTCDITYTEDNETKSIENNLCLIENLKNYQTIEEMIVGVIREKLEQV